MECPICDGELVAESPAELGVIDVDCLGCEMRFYGVLMDDEDGEGVILGLVRIDIEEDLKRGLSL